jgi:aspartate/methionine/tyrosine aminotransferase
MTGRGVNPVFGSQGTTIFTIMSTLAAQHNAINLGQGFPDEDGPKAIREAAARAFIEGPNQYPQMRGVLPLRKAIAAHSKRFHNLDFDPETEIVVTSGATEALAACMLGLAGPGDEAIIIEPAYDCYRPILEAAGAKVKAVRLQPPDWLLDERALAAAFSSKTKLVVVNTPLNPIGRVFTRKELELLAGLVKHHDATVVCDEVYEHLVFDGREHVSVLSLPDMRERSVRVGSAGKIFSLTGWKVGWIEGPANLVRAIANAHQFLTFTTPPGLQIGVAYGLEKEMEFTLNLTRELQQKRDVLAAALARAGFDMLPCEGTYFLTASIRNITNEPDRVFCERLTREAGITPVPLSAFFGPDGPTHLVRFAFCKKRPVIEDVVKRLEKHFKMR